MVNLRRKSIGEGQIILGSRSVASWTNAFTAFDNWHSRAYGTWDTLLKYCWWDLRVNNISLGEPRRVTSPQELAGSVITPYLTDEGGGNYSGAVAFKLAIEVDEEDTFPHLRVCRNSLVASARGRRLYNSHLTIQSGISGTFNTPAYYLNFWNQTGQLFIQHYTTVLPGSNNDGVVWWPQNTSNKENWIEVGNSVALPAPGQRAACWDTVGLSYVTPVPGGPWAAQAPFLWTEFGKNRTLTTENITGAGQNLTALQGPTALVFPVVQGNYVAFLVHAHSFDTFITDYVDPSIYELVLRVRYRQGKHSYYTTLTPVQHDNDSGGIKKTLFNLFDGGSVPVYKLEGYSSIDSNLMPTTLQICRRNIHTGVHSPWVTLATLKRRLPQAPLRLDPVLRKQ